MERLGLESIFLVHLEKKKETLQMPENTFTVSLGSSTSPYKKSEETNSNILSLIFCQPTMKQKTKLQF